MSDENQPVTAATLLPSSSHSLSQTVVWLQRGLLVLLALAHGSMPFLFTLGESDLLRDAVFHAQLSLLLILLTLGGLRWWSCLLLFASSVPLLGWMRVYPEYLHEFIFRASVLPLAVLVVALAMLWLCGWRGTWRDSSAAKSFPWQISIWQLLVATTLVGSLLAASSWTRDILGNVAVDPMFNLWLIIAIDGLGAATLSLMAVWALGTRGGAIQKGVLLLVATILFAGCGIYTFKMEEFWQLAALTSGCWIAVTAGTLLVFRIAGWQVCWSAEANLLGRTVQALRR